MISIQGIDTSEGKHGLSQLQTFVDHYDALEKTLGFGVERRSGGTFGLQVIHADQSAGELIDPPMSEIAIVSSLAPCSEGIEFDFGDGWKRGVFDIGTLDLQPCETECIFRLPEVSLRAITVPSDIVASKLDEIGLAPSLLNAVTGEFRHLPRATACSDRIWAAMDGFGPAATLATDAAFLDLLGELLSACGDETVAAPVPFVGNERISRVIDYIEAHLSHALSVGELADIACVSLFHFGRIFKREVGVTPHRYVMSRRLERAKELLVSSNLDITTIAFVTGFASHSHLADCFRARHGVAPSVWRNEKLA